MRIDQFEDEKSVTSDEQLPVTQMFRLCRDAEQPYFVKEEVYITRASYISSGTYGSVFRAGICPKQNNQDFKTKDVAIKKIVATNLNNYAEIGVLKMLDHPNIVKMLYYYLSEGQNQDERNIFINIVMEFMPMNLHTYIRKSLQTSIEMSRSDSITFSTSSSVASITSSVPAVISVYTIALIMYQVFMALHHLRSKNLCHRDIKTKNILIDHTNYFKIKLCDFGCAVMIKENKSVDLMRSFSGAGVKKSDSFYLRESVTYMGSRFYRSPEMLFQYKDYDLSVDIWSAGCVLAEMMCGYYFFRGEDSMRQAVIILRTMGTPKPLTLIDSIIKVKGDGPTFSSLLKRDLAPKPLENFFNKIYFPFLPDLFKQMCEILPQNRITPEKALVLPQFEAIFHDLLRKSNLADAQRQFIQSLLDEYYLLTKQN